jgi:hypothetical protein
MGELYQRTGRQEMAVAMYQRSLQNKWNQPAVQSRLATLTRPNRLGGAYPQVAFAAPPPGFAYGPPAILGSPSLAAAPAPGGYQSASLPDSFENADPAHMSDLEYDDAAGPL